MRETQKRSSGSWLWIISDLAITVIWQVNQSMEAFSLFLSLLFLSGFPSFCNSIFQIIIFKESYWIHLWLPRLMFQREVKISEQSVGNVLIFKSQSQKHWRSRWAWSPPKLHVHLKPQNLNSLENRVQVVKVKSYCSRVGPESMVMTLQENRVTTETRREKTVIGKWRDVSVLLRTPTHCQWWPKHSRDRASECSQPPLWLPASRSWNCEEINIWLKSDTQFLAFCCSSCKELICQINP